MTLAMHSRASVEWYTPPDLVEACRSVLGDFELDPASCKTANKTVRAGSFYGAGGASKPWWGRVFINPPGGQVGDFWGRLLEARRDITAAIWIGFSIEQLATLQRYELSPLHFQTCVLRRRVRFLDADGTPSKRPTHSSYVTYVPGLAGPTPLFAHIFSAWGVVS